MKSKMLFFARIRGGRTFFSKIEVNEFHKFIADMKNDDLVKLS
jgi:hypothetical protein